MKIDLPETIEHGDRARLFPVVADTSRENRLTSVFLALLPHVPAFAKDLFHTVGLRVGQRAKIACWSEVVPAHSDHSGKRPDGLIVVKSGKTTWTALVEAKIKTNPIEEDQVVSYLEIARDCNFDAVITISNQFVARTDLHPVKVSKTLLRKTSLYHWSWTYIRTQCEIVQRDCVDDPEQEFILSEFLRLLEHKDTGVQRFTLMNRNWQELVQTVSNHGTLNKNDPNVEECVGCWFQEERDISLQLTRHVGAKVETVIGNRLKDNPTVRLNEGIKQLIEDKALSAKFRIPNCAADLEVCAHLMSRTLSYSMKLKAPIDRKSTKARVNWLLRMLRSDDGRIIVRAHWPGRVGPTDAAVDKLCIDPNIIQAETSAAAPHSFEVLVINNLGRDFTSRKKFIEQLEQGIRLFYELVGQRLKAWQAPPPKPVKSHELTEAEDIESKN